VAGDADRTAKAVQRHSGLTRELERRSSSPDPGTEGSSSPT
jgi:hypothetical protein